MEKLNSKHILSSNQFEIDEISQILELSKDYKQKVLSDEKVSNESNRNHSIISLFYEPSTRTRISFEQAAINLGFHVISTENAKEFSSAAKGESLYDTLKVLDKYMPKAIVIRHHQTGEIHKVAPEINTPIINAGDGKGEHPTQALLDLFTIYEEFNRTSNLNITFAGDLKYGRTVRSLAKLLSKYDQNNITFLSHKDFMIEPDIKDYLKCNNTEFHETEDFIEAISDADVLYWTRTQKERFEEVDTNYQEFILNNNILKHIKNEAIIMHPLPRNDEINPKVDSSKQARYFEQAGNGLFVRMALLDLVTRK